MRVLEIGCGPGVAARLVAARVGERGFVLAIDRSATAIRQARLHAPANLELRQCAVEDFVLAEDEDRFDLVFAMRVGAFDGRHPQLEERARAAVAAALRPRGRFVIDPE